MSGRIRVNGGVSFTPVIVSTICGHWGAGLMPLVLKPDYLSFMKLVRETGTTELTKSSTFEGRRGNFIWWNPYSWKYVQRIGEGSLLNAYAHTNLGIHFNVRMMALARNLGFDVIPNFAPDFSKPAEEIIKEALYAVEMIVDYGFKIIEFVPSCPNRNHCVADNVEIMAECIKAVKKRWPHIFVIVKKGLQHPTEAIQEWKSAGMDMLHGINAIPYETVLSGKVSPLAHVGGGAVSGDVIREIAFEDNCKSRKVYSGPMIFGGGISNYQEILKCFKHGADIVSICKVARCDVKEAKKIIRLFNRN
jgi:dihydroorotate dehydrogenase (NAD+) catalytic subunit